MRSLLTHNGPLPLVTALAALLATGVLSLLLIFSYDPAVGHFGSTLLEGLWFFLLLLLGLLLLVTARLSPAPVAPLPPFTAVDRAVSFLSGLALAAVGLVAFADVFDAADPIVQVLVSLAALAALVQSGFFLFSGILTKSTATFAPLSLFFVLYGMALYFKPLPVMNDPLKITVILAAVSLALLFLLLERQKAHAPQPRLSGFVGALSALLSFTVALPLSVYLIATESGTAEMLSFLLLILVFGIGIFVRLFFPAPSLEVSHEDNSGC
jgi:hypothetical protein